MSGFLEATALNLTRAIGRALTSEEIARRRGLLQALDPRVRLLGVLALVIAVTLSRKPMVVATLLTLAIVLALLSRVSLATLAKRVWLVVFLFTATIALPALFVTPGRAVHQVLETIHADMPPVKTETDVMSAHLRIPVVDDVVRVLFVQLRP